MGRISINRSGKKGFCEVLRVETKENVVNPYFKAVTVIRLYRSDGAILEKNVIDKVKHKYSSSYKPFDFGWELLGKTREPPDKWARKYEDKWTITTKTKAFMAKYLSKSEIKRLKNGL